AVERRPICRAMAGDADVAGLTGRRCSRVVARSLLEIGHAHALDDGALHAEPRYLEDGDRLARGRRRRGGDRFGRRDGGRYRRTRRVGDGVAQLACELVLQLPLAAGLGQPGAPQLVDDEQQREDPEEDEDAADAAYDPAHHVRTVRLPPARLPGGALSPAPPPRAGPHGGWLRP